MQTTLADFRYAVRTFWKAPGFSAAATLTLALGIGVNIAVFSLFHAALIDTLPVREPHKLVQVYTWTGSNGDHYDFSYPLYVDLRDKAESLEGLAAYLSGTVGLAAGDRSERLIGEFVTSNYFPLLGIQPTLGPGLTGADELRGGPKVAVISHTLWRDMFGSDTGIVGRAVLINGQTFTIVGVAPRGFTGIVRGQRADLWISLSQFFPLRNRPDLLTARDSSWLNLLGRLAPGVSEEQAQHQLTAVVRQISRPADVTPDYAARIRQSAAGDTGLVEGLDTPLRLLMVTVGLILLIACANVANLLLARSSARQQEIAVRQALGASRSRIARQILSETLVLSAAGALAGLLLAVWIVDMVELRPGGAATPLALTTGLKIPVLLFATAMALGSALAAGLIPAFGMSRSDLVDVIKRGAGVGSAPARRRTRSGLAIVQIAVSLVLIVGAGLFLRSLAKLRSIEPTLATDKVIAATLNLTLRGYNEPRGQQFYEQLFTRVSQLPEVEAATLTSVLPVTGGGTRINLQPRATAPAIDAPFEADMITVSPGYFRTFGIPLVRGRDFTLSDRTPGRQVTIINETMKQRLWGDADPLGQTFSFGDREADRFEVIAVARDTKYRNLREGPRMSMYLPLAQSYAQGMNLVVRTSTTAEAAVSGMRRELAAVDSALPLYNVRTLAEHVNRSLYVDALRARLVSALALLAVALAGVGIYGLVSFIVSERTKEVGLRLALGAKPSEVLRLMLGTGSRLAVSGIALGLVLSLWLTRKVAAELYGVTATDPIALVGASLFLYAIVLLATLIPALRVMRVDPMRALRQGG